MRIAMIHDYQPDLGGTTEVVIRMARALKKRGHSCKLITHPESWIMEHDKSSIELVCAPKYKLTFMEYIPHHPVKVGKIVSLYTNKDIELCHAHYALPYGLTAYLAKQTCGIPYVITLHGTDVHRLASISSLRPVLKLCLENADVVTSVCEYLKGRATTKLDLRRNIVVVPNFVDVRRFRKRPAFSALRREFNIHKGHSVVTHISNYASIKNTLIIPDIARILLQKHPNVVFLMVGEKLGKVGFDLEKLRRKVSKLGLDEKFRFAGRRGDVERVLNLSDVSILTSLNEGAPLAALESLAAGVPVVSSRVGGIPELIEHGGNGFLVEKQNVERYAQYISRLIQRPNLREKLGCNGMALVHARYSEEIVMSQYLELYETVRRPAEEPDIG